MGAVVGLRALMGNELRARVRRASGCTAGVIARSIAGGGAAVLLALGTLLLAAPDAGALEAINGRFQAHGYFEMQIRTLNRNYSDQWDVSQWYNIFNLELEMDLVQDTHGPLDLLSAYMRIEARFDCIYSRGCGMVKPVDLYGNRSRRMPRRLNSAVDYESVGQIPIRREKDFANADRDPLRINEVPGFEGIYDAAEEGLGPVERQSEMRCNTSIDGCAENSPTIQHFKIPERFWQSDRNKRITVDGMEAADDGTDGAPFLLVMDKFEDFKFGAIPVVGGSNGGHAIAILGPWLPKNFVERNASLANLANPMDASRIVVQSLAPGAGSNPMRPIPYLREDDPEASRIFINRTRDIGSTDPRPFQGWEVINPASLDLRDYADRAAEPWEARGLFVPSPNLREGLREGRWDSYPFNFSELERAFNRGASQQDEGELKEAYLDIEMFDSRLWMRIGKQSIVWGKTELFRTTDQFNPQDFGLGNLPSLEESRVSLWAWRGVWSFYEVGPVQDLRVELAFNFDEYESADLGSCGEPYAVNLVCNLTFGSFAHGFTGVGIAGFEKPEAPWESFKGWEIGGRIEWRWDRFSFALSDFYGYDDFPHPRWISTYNRNVDWRTGRPRHYMHGEAALRLTTGGEGCAAPTFVTPSGKTTTQGALHPDLNAGDPGAPYVADLNSPPEMAAARVLFTGAGNEGCLAPGSTNRQARIIESAFGDYGVPFRVLAEDLPNQNIYAEYAGQFYNDSLRSDPNDPRHYHSEPFDPDSIPGGRMDYPGGPNATLCGTKAEFTALIEAGADPSAARDSGYSTADCGGQPVPTTLAAVETYTEPGARMFNTAKYLGDGRLNPEYNPYYNPRRDRYFDVSYSNTLSQVPDPDPDDLFAYAANPGDIIATTPVLYDPFTLNREPGLERDDTARLKRLWWNAYDPTLVYNENNALDNNPVNLSVFNWICATTIAFSDLDSTSCAMTIFGSTKSAQPELESGPRISFVINGLVGGSAAFLSFLGNNPSDRLLSKGPGLPRGMAGPIMTLNADLQINDRGQTITQGLGSFRTRDLRREWADNLAGQQSAFIYSREAESYNCISNFAQRRTNGFLLCGGLGVSMDSFDPDRPGSFSRAYSVDSGLARTLTPEQEALIGCGPYYGTNCTANGVDLLNSEGSAILQSFIGSESHGLPFVQLGIAHLVSGRFGTHLMDGGSDSTEYRTDGRVVGKNGKLLRIDPVTNQPVLGTLTGLLDEGKIAAIDNPLIVNGGQTRCNYDNLGNDTFLPNVIGSPLVWNGSGDSVQGNAAVYHRWNPRCWDDRKYYRVYGIQPGTAAFEILGLGSPKCTTADIGGPLGAAGTLPGCRNKWATILYSPDADWDGVSELHPNNPDAGYIGNHYYGQRMGWKYDLMDVNARPNPRTDYRQFGSQGVVDDSVDPSTVELAADATLTGPGGPCKATGDAAYGDASNYDCRILAPSEGLSGLGTGASVRWIGQSPGDPSYDAAVASRRSGLNWGTYWADYNDFARENGREAIAAPEGCKGGRADMDCYLGGWRQTVDGNPDRIGVIGDLTVLVYPKFIDDSRAVPEIYDLATWDPSAGGTNRRAIYENGELLRRVEQGCTPAAWSALLQRNSDNQLIEAPACAHTFQAPRTDASLDPGDGGPSFFPGPASTGHPFTGESFSSEMAGLSFNLMMMLVSLDEDFRDGLASVRAYVNPELYESRFIWDERWMWDTTDPRYDPLYGNTNQGIQRNDCFMATDPDHPDYDPNHKCVRQVAGRQFVGLGKEVGEIFQINPLPDGEVNKFQRDSRVRNILDDFPDLVFHECKRARWTGVADPRLCNTASDWDQNAQNIRLGDNGLLRTMLWDYAFTGTDNDLMAMIPYCEDLEYSQRWVDTTEGDGVGVWGPNRVDCTKGLGIEFGGEGKVLGHQRCTFVTPQYCGIIQSIFSIAGQKRNILRAGGSNGFGRRTMQWHSGGEVYLAYEKRNVLGFSMDFAEDVSKSNWSMEFTWIEGLPQVDNNSYNLTTKTNDFNLTVSVDRPTFINFLNPNRTFFINSQWFFQYRQNYSSGMSGYGPFNALATLAVFTGYFQDRLNPRMVLVYDFMSTSGAVLPQVGYRFSEAFSITVGASMFWGRQRLVDMPVNGIAPAGPRAGADAYYDGTTPALAIIKDRDEVFMTLRYTF